MIDKIDQHREELKALAEREDLNASKYAKALLDANKNRDERRTGS